GDAPPPLPGGGRDARRVRDGSRDPLVPQRALPGLQEEAGVPAELLAQFPLAEEAMAALGLVVWPMLDFEADDALAAGAARFAGQTQQVILATPDKDLAQCVRGKSVVMLDRRRRTTLDEDGVRAKSGVSPGSIPDWLAPVGDSADGYPGLPGWGERSAAAVLARYATIEADDRCRRGRSPLAQDRHAVGTTAGL